MERTVESIGAKMDALGMWNAAKRYNWAVKPRGSAFPYFCSMVDGDRARVKLRFLMIDGWETFGMYVRTRIDPEFGFYSTPIEMPHLELVFLEAGGVALLRYDTGYIPREATGVEKELCAKILWESYGIMLRLETDGSLPMKFASEKAMFARVEDGDGWRDAALPIPPPRPYVESVQLRKDAVAKANDLPFDAGKAIEADFGLETGISTSENRPRAVYRLRTFDAETGARKVFERVSLSPDFGLKQMWESVPARLLAHFIAEGRIPGEIRVRSGRLFRMLRPLCANIPVKLTFSAKLAHV